MGMFSLCKFAHAWTGILGSDVRVYKPNYCARSIITLSQGKYIAPFINIVDAIT